MLLPYSLLADVIAIVYLLLGFVADVIATVVVGIANQISMIDVSYCGRCYCHHWLADVIAIVYVLLYCVADVVATMADGITEQKPSVQTKMCCTRKNNTFSRH